MRENFDKSLVELLKHEGGFVTPVRPRRRYQPRRNAGRLGRLDRPRSQRRKHEGAHASQGRAPVPRDVLGSRQGRQTAQRRGLLRV